MGADFTDELIAHVPWVGGHADVWRAFSDGAFFPRLVSALADPYREDRITKVAGIEARGFILGAAVAVELGVGFVAIRKEGGLFPGEKAIRVAEADYRGNRAVLQLQRASLSEFDRVVLVDDWSEVGSQAYAARCLVEEAGADFVGASIVVDQLSDEARGRIGRVAALITADRLAHVPAGS